MIFFSLFEGQIRTGQINERELGPPGSAFYCARMRTGTHTESSSWAKIQARRIDGNKFGFLAWIRPDKASAAKRSESSGSATASLISERS